MDIKINQVVPKPLNGSLESLRAVIEATEHKTTVRLNFPCAAYAESWQQQIRDAVGDSTLRVNFEQRVKAHKVQSTLKGVPHIKNIIAVASGKGGVGKSTTTANLAIALSRLGARVGVLDADIYGPSMPTMLGVAKGKPESIEGKYLKPVTTYEGIQVMSMGFLLPDEDAPVVWRGPMVSKALQQLLFDTKWDDLDYLLIDLPPGTGDIQLTLCQKIPLSGAVIVTTPQDIALLDVKKAVQMFNKVSVTCLGVVENMSHYVCPNCSHEDPIFGHGGAARLATEFDLPLLGQIPLNAIICQQGDSGEPVALHAQSEISQYYLDAALRTVSTLSLQPQNYAVKFPDIIVE